MRIRAAKMLLTLRVAGDGCDLQPCSVSSSQPGCRLDQDATTHDVRQRCRFALTMKPDRSADFSIESLQSLDQSIRTRPCVFSRPCSSCRWSSLFSIPTPGRGDDKDAAIRDGTKMLDEGDKLADQGQFTEAVIRYKRGMEQLLPQLRKIPFKHEVKRDVTKRENMKALILKEIDEDMTPAEFRANELAMKAFGLLPRDFNLRETLAQVYAEEVAAFYDPKTKTMHLIEEPKVEKKKPPTFLERLFGKKDEFDKDENKTVIAHELTHALADQHYDLDAMQEAVKKDDDRSLAISALIEGEATLAMFGAGMDDWDGDEIVKLPAENLEWTFNLLSSFLPFLGGGKALRNAPPIISESMIFPYLKGMVFCAKLTNKGGWAAIDDVYRNPPLSTEQILHPEKYRAEPGSAGLHRPGRAQARGRVEGSRPQRPG